MSILSWTTATDGEKDEKHENNGRKNKMKKTEIKEQYD